MPKVILFISTVEKFELSILCTQIMFLTKGRLSKKNYFIIIILQILKYVPIYIRDSKERLFPK